MVKLETYRRRRRRPNITMCALAAALISVALIAGVELAGPPIPGVSAGLRGAPHSALESGAAATAPLYSTR
jgi:hypothetical protein